MDVKSILKINLTTILFLVYWTTTPLLSQIPFQLDSLFGSDGKTYIPIGPSSSSAAQDKSYQIAQQSDGKIILAGYSNDIGGTEDWVIAVVRLHTTGMVDSSFGINGVSKVNFAGEDDECWAVEVQTDDKIVLTGRIWTGSHTKMGIVRLTPDGQLDATFDSDGKVLYEIGTQSDEGFDLAIQPDNKILAVGRAWQINSETGWAVMRLLPDGQLDSSFNSAGRFYFNSGFHDELATCVVLQDDGKILLGGSINLRPSIIRLLPNGDFDPSFNTTGIYTNLTLSGQVTSIAIDSADRIVYTAYSHNGLCKTGRLLPDGTADLSFGDAGVTVFNTNQNSFYTSYDKAMLLPDGKILGLGSFESDDPFDNIRRLTLLLLSENGEILESFLSNPNMQFHICYYDIWVIDAITLNDGSIGITSPGCSMQKNYDMLAVKLQYSPATGVFSLTPSSQDITIYPNPATEQIRIENLSHYQSEQIQLYNALGELITERSIDQPTMTLSLPKVNGTYFIRVGDVAKKVVKVDSQ